MRPDVCVVLHGRHTIHCELICILMYIPTVKSQRMVIGHSRKCVVELCSVVAGLGRWSLVLIDIV